jgi:hypothetical protein
MLSMVRSSATFRLSKECGLTTHLTLVLNQSTNPGKPRRLKLCCPCAHDFSQFVVVSELSVPFSVSEQCEILPLFPAVDSISVMPPCSLFRIIALVTLPYSRPQLAERAFQPKTDVFSFAPSV